MKKYIIKIISSILIQILLLRRGRIRAFLHTLFPWRHLIFESRKKFKNELAICVIAKDEGFYIKEWLDFHFRVGIDKVYFFDNGSTDNTAEILRPYIESGLVEHNFIPGKSIQRVAYSECVAKYFNDTKWLAFIDMDEFLVPMQNEDLKKTINDIVGTDTGIGQILVGWRNFGSSGHKKKPAGGVLENFLYHEIDVGKTAHYHKTITNPRRIRVIGVHGAVVMGKSINENGVDLNLPEITKPYYSPHFDFAFPKTKLAVYHYPIKSAAEFMAKQKRGDVLHAHRSYKNEYWNRYDNNDVYDDTMLKRFKK